jgi:putative DNA primase/helicase
MKEHNSDSRADIHDNTNVVNLSKHETALHLSQELGWAIFPLSQWSKLPAIPREKGGRGFKDGTTVKRQIDNWWLTNAEYNIGITTGVKSGITVIDLDIKNGKDGLNELAKLEVKYGKLPKTLTVITPSGGFHYVYKYNDKLRDGSNRLGNGIDVKNNGGCIVGVNSEVNGFRYRLAEGYTIDTPLAELPEWVINVARQNSSSVAVTNVTAIDLKSFNNKHPACVVHLLVNGAPSDIENYNQANLMLADYCISKQYTGQQAEVLATEMAKHTADDYKTGMRSIEDKLNNFRTVFDTAKQDPNKYYFSCGFMLACDDLKDVCRREDCQIRDQWSEQQKLEINFGWNDWGCAERFAYYNKDTVRYCQENDKYYVWNGRYWQEQDESEIYNRIKESNDHILDDLKDTNGNGNSHAKKLIETHNSKVLSFHKSRLSSGKLRGIYQLAAKQRRLQITLAELDTDPELLNCKNGIINLRTSELLFPHDKDKLITQYINIEFDNTAESELWNDTLKKALPNDNIRNYLQLMVGYAATGYYGDRSFIYAFGQPRTLKSTLLGAIGAALGSYAETADRETFVDKKRSAGSAKPDITKLQNKRFISAPELDQSQYWNSNFLKDWVGGDRQTARELYKAGIEFEPIGKFFFTGNSIPKANSEDEAFFERMRVIPFTRQIPRDQMDTTVKDTLKNDPEIQQAILRWIVDGAQWYLKVRDSGKQISVPDEIELQNACQIYENSPLFNYGEDELIYLETEDSRRTDDGKKIAEPQVSEIFNSYKMWCERNKIKKPLTQKAATNAFKILGIGVAVKKDNYRNSYRCYQNVFFRKDIKCGELDLDGEKPGTEQLDNYCTSRINNQACLRVYEFYPPILKRVL